MFTAKCNGPMKQLILKNHKNKQQTLVFLVLWFLENETDIIHLKMKLTTQMSYLTA